MLRVLNISPKSLTADITKISADTTEISADTTHWSPAHILKIPYRFFSDNVILILKNELTEIEDIFNLIATKYEGGYLTLTFEFEFNHIEGDSFEATLLDSVSSRLMWRGKIFTTNQDDLQNYDLYKYNKNENGVVIL